MKIPVLNGRAKRAGSDTLRITRAFPEGMKGALLRILGYVVLMSAAENLGGERFGALARFAAAGLALALLALDMRRKGVRFSEAKLSDLPYGRLLFRGYLFRALRQESLKTAVLVSGLTFGLGHIVNLLNGAELLPTLMQGVYAMAIGVMLSTFMARAKHIAPCCAFHAVFNALSTFSNEAGQTVGDQLAASAATTALAAGYAAYLWRMDGGLERGDGA